MKILIAILFLTSCWTASYCGVIGSMQLKDLPILTLQYGKMTTARRLLPIPQLKCVGGTAGCSAFTPKVVQCSNKGWDGTDFQWDCQTDMDNAYRFGKISISCEDYPNKGDPNILIGSCGLEYTIDLTKEGIENQQRNPEFHDYYGNQGSNYVNKKPPTTPPGQNSNLTILWVILGVLLFVALIALIICAVSKPYSASSEPIYYSSSSMPYSGGVSYGQGNPSLFFLPSPYRPRDNIHIHTVTPDGSQNWGGTTAANLLSTGTRTAHGFGGTTHR